MPRASGGRYNRVDRRVIGTNKRTAFAKDVRHSQRRGLPEVVCAGLEIKTEQAHGLASERTTYKVGSFVRHACAALRLQRSHLSTG